MTTPQSAKQKHAVDNQRSELLYRFECWFETPMIVLSFAWLGLLIFEFSHGQTRWSTVLTDAIWIIFIVDFLIRYAVAPEKRKFLINNWLTALSLVVPALRGFRIFAVLRIAHVTRGLTLLRVLGSINRGMAALGATMQRRKFGYVVLLTALVTFAGAAGMLAFERDVPRANGIHSYGEALWFTSMIVTTLGSEYWPQTTEGRLLCFLISVYALAVLGYITATLATFFIDRDAENEDAELAGQRSIEALRAEIAALRADLKQHRRGDNS